MSLAKLKMILTSPNYRSETESTITPEQWGDITALAHGSKTQRENMLCDTVHDLRGVVHDLKALLQAIVADAGACDAECYSVAMPLIESAAQYLKENP